MNPDKPPRRASKLQDVLTYPPRLMNAERSAAYLDLSKTTFLAGVASGRWPQPKDAGGVNRWDRRDLDAAVDALDNGTRKRVPSGRRTLAEMLEAEEHGQGEPAA